MQDKPFILTLVTPEDQSILSDPSFQTRLQENGLKGPLNWLKRGQAAEMSLSAEEKTIAETSLMQQFAEAPVDYAITPQKNRRKKLLISDMDSTIIEEECIDEIAAMAGLKPKVAAITERAMRGELEFNAALKERVALLKGLTLKELDEVIDNRLHLSKGARTLVRTMAANGAHCALVSGGFTFFTEKIAALTGFHSTSANTLEFNDGTLTGAVIPPILGSAAKKEALEKLIIANNLKPEETLAVGDGANDLEMIQEAGLGVAYKAKPIVREKASAAINHTDLQTLLYFQGYNHSDFIHSEIQP